MIPSQYIASQVVPQRVTKWRSISKAVTYIRSEICIPYGTQHRAWKEGFEEKDTVFTTNIPEALTPMSASVGDQCMSSSEYSIHELPDPESDGSFTKSSDPSDTRFLSTRL